MVERRPVCMIGGQMKELPLGDSLPGGGGSAALTAATTSGAAQEVDLSAADIHICDLDVPVVNLTFTASTPVARCSVHLKQSYDVVGTPSTITRLSGYDLLDLVKANSSISYTDQVHMAADGSAIFIQDNLVYEIAQINLNTPGTLDGGYSWGGVSPHLQAALVTSGRDMRFSHGGHKLFVATNARKVETFDLTVPGDITTLDLNSKATWDVNAVMAATGGFRPMSIQMLDDTDTKFAMVDQNTYNWQAFTMSTPGDITTAAVDAGNVIDTSAFMGKNSTLVRSFLSADKSNLFVLDGKVFYRVDFGTPGYLPSAQLGAIVPALIKDRDELGLQYCCPCENFSAVLVGTNSLSGYPSHSKISMRENTLVVCPGNLKMPASLKPPTFGLTHVLQIATYDGGSTFILESVTEDVK